MSLVLQDPFPFSISPNFWQALPYQQRYTEGVSTNTKKLIVIVPGSKTKTVSWPFIGPLLKRFFEQYGVQDVQGEDDMWYEPIRAAFIATGADVMIFEWSGGISPFDVRKAARELRGQLHKHAEKEIILFGKSLGGTVTEIVARDPQLSITRVVSVATPHFMYKHPLPSSIETINICSPAENYLKFANRFLYFGLGRMSVSNARNISIPNLRHSDFDHNVKVEYGGKTMPLFNFYRELLV